MVEHYPFLPLQHTHTLNRPVGRYSAPSYTPLPSFSSITPALLRTHRLTPPNFNNKITHPRGPHTNFQISRSDRPTLSSYTTRVPRVRAALPRHVYARPSRTSIPNPDPPRIRLRPPEPDSPGNPDPHAPGPVSYSTALRHPLTSPRTSTLLRGPPPKFFVFRLHLDRPAASPHGSSTTPTFGSSAPVNSFTRAGHVVHPRRSTRSPAPVNSRPPHGDAYNATD